MDQKLKNLKKAIKECDGVPIPMNIIRQNIQPLYEWLKTEE